MLFRSVSQSRYTAPIELREGSITRTKLALEDIIHAIQLLSDEVANNQKIIDSEYNKGYDKGRKDGYEECIEKYDL